MITLIFCLNAMHPAFSEASKQNHVPILSPDSLNLSLWQERSFEGHTNYAAVKEGNIFSIKAHCDGTASAIYKTISVDLTKTPILHWSWKVDNIHNNLDDISKSGDDYAARIYVVYKGLFPWDINALNYVWANKQAKGSSWPNAFSKRAIMRAQQSGAPKNHGTWINESRNIREDFKNYFGLDITKIDGVAIMTDCDNSGGTATAHYRNIQFSPL